MENALFLHTIYKNPLLETNKIKITYPQTECFTYPINGHWRVVHINFHSRLPPCSLAIHK